MSDEKVLVSQDLLKEILDSLPSIKSLPVQYYGSTLGDRIRTLLAQPSDGALTNEGAEPVGYCAWNTGTNPGTRLMRYDGAVLVQPERRGIFEVPVYLHPPKVCTCPSGDGSLRWPCPVHPPEVNSPPDQVACMPVDRSYDVRAKMIIAFNECKKNGGDLDDCLDAAYKSALRFTPSPASTESRS